MSTLDLCADDLLASDEAPRLSFFDWILKARTGLRNRRMRRAGAARRLHLPELDFSRLRQGGEKAKRAAAKARK
jgi:hypothetical protein